MRIVINYEDVVILNKIEDAMLGNFFRDCNIDNYVEVENGYGLALK